MYLQEATSDYIDAALKCIFQIHYTCPPGDVLVFLAGQEEIENLKAQIETYLPTLDAKKMQVSFLSPRVLLSYAKVTCVATRMPVIRSLDAF